MPDDSTALNQTLDNATLCALLQSRNGAGHWVGELSSSALSTATALFALSTFEQANAGIDSARRDELRALVNRGIDWLCSNQNTDGGWGDTVLSISNISTTALCWAALSVGGDSVSSAVANAESWLSRAAGSLEPAKLAAAIKARYGKDKTFSVPILTMCALAGRLDDRAALPAPNLVGSASRTNFSQVRQMVRSADPTQSSVPPVPSPAEGGGEETIPPVRAPAALHANSTRNANASVGSALADASSDAAASGRTRPPRRTLRQSQCRPAAWRFVPQLPFELAACPYQWFQWLRLPVVSYALPALIAIGHVRHANRPTWNPLARALRNLTRNRTLRVLTEIQPKGGGFLEATPLTSFVVMSLVGSGQCQHPVTANGIDFLIRSIQPDGSWPIDTNLSTWVTTLSINALASHPEFDRILSQDDRLKLRDWLLGQQYRVEHPYTHAAPGAWAWTDLPGGVPDADDTAGALLALWNLGFRDAKVLDAVNAGVNWLLDLQNRDGGVPTFCRGWGNLPFDRSGSDLTAHAIHAWVTWRSLLSSAVQLKIDKAVQRGLAYLAKQQRPDGAWIPLWFGNQFAPGDDNPTYGTSRVLVALCAIDPENVADDSMIRRGAGWLLKSQTEDGGWGSGRMTPSSIEETSLATNALILFSHRAAGRADDATIAAIERGLQWLRTQTEQGRKFTPSPIGLYFAKLWYFERLYPTIFACSALARNAAASI